MTRWIPQDKINCFFFLIKTYLLSLQQMLHKCVQSNVTCQFYTLVSVWSFARTLSHPVSLPAQSLYLETLKILMCIQVKLYLRNADFGYKLNNSKTESLHQLLSRMGKYTVLIFEWSNITFGTMPMKTENLYMGSYYTCTVFWDYPSIRTYNSCKSFLVSHLLFVKCLCAFQKLCKSWDCCQLF